MQKQQEQSNVEFADSELEYEDDFNSMPEEVREHALDAGHPAAVEEPTTSDPEPSIEETAPPQEAQPTQGNPPADAGMPGGQKVEEAAPEKPVPDTSVMGVGSFMGAIILLSLPVFNIIFIIEWAFSRHVNRNKRNLARAALLVRLILVLVFVGICLAARHWYQFDLLGFLITKFKGY